MNPTGDYRPVIMRLRRDGWIQRASMAHGPDGRIMCCLGTAIDSERLPRAPVIAAIKRLYPFAGWAGGNEPLTIEAFNDARATTFDDVVAVLKAASATGGTGAENP